MTPLQADLDQWEHIVNQLRGSCDSLASLGPEAEELENNTDFCAYLDERIFCCTRCGWWCDQDEEASEEHGLAEWTCRDCCESG